MDYQSDTISNLDNHVASTLLVGRNASLTLGTDALIIHGKLRVDNTPKASAQAFANIAKDESAVSRSSTNCCGLLPNSSKVTRSVPFYSVLWASLSEVDITIHYARKASKNRVRPVSVNYNIERTDRDVAVAWTTKLLQRAYGTAKKQKRIKVLVNPFGGQGKAQRLFLREIEPILAAAHCEVDVETTQYSGHAVEIAEKLDIEAWDVVASCSGDGLPHEVWNGLGRRPDANRALQKIAVVQFPCGSGNALSINLNGTDSCSLAALSVVKGIETPFDLVSVTQGSRRILSFLSQSFGIVAEADLDTEHLRWMGGARFTYGVLVRLFGKRVWPCDLAVAVEIHDKSEIKEAYYAKKGMPAQTDAERERHSNEGLPSLQFGTVNDPLPKDWTLVPYEKMGNFYAGNMAYMSADVHFFPAAHPSDGCMDLVCINGDIPLMQGLQILLAAEHGGHLDMSHVSYRKIKAYRIIPRGRKAGSISVDGERIDFAPFQAEVHPGLGTVLSKSGHLYEAAGPRR